MALQSLCAQVLPIKETDIPFEELQNWSVDSAGARGGLAKSLVNIPLYGDHKITEIGDAVRVL